ncbi:MAG: lysophospholipid acyltransferase family protein [Planctomycetota bacterium]
MEPKPLVHRFVYESSRLFMQTVGRLLFRTQVIGLENWPKDGGGLVCSNHQSFVDPAFLGVSCPRAMNYVARENLFKNPLFRAFIVALNAFPIDREGLGLSGLKTTLRLLKGGELVVIFPEGTRTPDGELQELQPGFIAVARRGKAPVIPIALDGAYHAWPRHKKLPGLAKVAIAVGQPISQDEIKSLSDDELLKEVARRIDDCLQQARDAREPNRQKVGSSTGSVSNASQ